MGAPGTMVEGAEKPVMRAVVRVSPARREVVRVRRGGRRIFVVFVRGRWWSSLYLIENRC